MKDNSLRLRWKDVIAIIIAVFQILAPKIIVVALSIIILMFLTNIFI